MYVGTTQPPINCCPGYAALMFAPGLSAQLTMRITTFLATACLVWCCSGCGQAEDTQQLFAEEPETIAEAPEQTAQEIQQQHDQAIRDTATAAGLHTLIVRAYKQEDYAQARADIALLGSRYPKSPQYARLSRLTGKLDSLLKAQQHRAAVKQEGRSHAMGLTAWGIAEYQDEFDEPNGHFFLVNSTMLWGEYADTDVASEDIAARIVVDSSSSIHLMLYDHIPTYAVRWSEPQARTSYGSYGRRGRSSYQLHEVAKIHTYYQRVEDYDKMRLVKAASPTRYVVKVRSSAGKVYTFLAVNPLDRITLNKTDSKTLHACLLEGGEIKFFITPANQRSTTYRFTLDSADEYEQSYHLLLQR